MSWDATLTDANGYSMGDWNYTHNTSVMIYDALAKVGSIHYTTAKSWWEQLNGLTGAEGGRYLDAIIKGMEATPEWYRGMNPENGWGDYDSLLRCLREMREACISEYPTEWVCSG